jgi:hypothetical protein
MWSGKSDTFMGSSAAGRVTLLLKRTKVCAPVRGWSAAFTPLQRVQGHRPRVSPSAFACSCSLKTALRGHCQDAPGGGAASWLVRAD